MKTTPTICSDSDARFVLAAGLRDRCNELEEIARTRVDALSEPNSVENQEYSEGLRSAITAAVAFGVSVIERGESRAPDIPPILLAQARLAARTGMELSTVLQRYFAGFALLDDFLIQEAETAEIASRVLTSVLRTQRTMFNRLLDAVIKEYSREKKSQLRSSEERIGERVQRLINGELIDTSDLPYDFSAQHVALVSAGPLAPKAVQTLARALDHRSLVVRRPDGTVWAWLGSRRPHELHDLEKGIHTEWPTEIPLAFGELGCGSGGWRLSHRQARATFPIALRTKSGPVRYADVALDASTCQDELLLISLKEIYLEPLSNARDQGETLRETLLAFFATGRSATGAAAKLGVARHTVTYRIRAVERLIGRPLDICAESLWAALRLEALGYTEAGRTRRLPNRQKRHRKSS